MTVHRELGHGFLEHVYQEALGIELKEREIPAKREVTLPVFYRGIALSTHYKADFVCYDSIIVELKATASLESAHDAQVINYIKATRIERGLLINFGAASLEYKRLILSKSETRPEQRGNQ